MNKQGPLKAIVDKEGLRNISTDCGPPIFVKDIATLGLQCVLDFFFHYNNIPPQVSPSEKRETWSDKDVAQHKLYAKKHQVNPGALLYNSAHVVKNTVLCAETFVHRVDHMSGGFHHTKKGTFISLKKKHKYRDLRTLDVPLAS